MGGCCGKKKPEDAGESPDTDAAEGGGAETSSSPVPADIADGTDNVVTDDDNKDGTKSVAPAGTKSTAPSAIKSTAPSGIKSTAPSGIKSTAPSGGKSTAPEPTPSSAPQPSSAPVAEGGD